MSAFELALGASYRDDPRPVHSVLAAPVLTLSRRAALHGRRGVSGLRVSHPAGWSD